MRLLKALAGGGRKGFTQPPFWSREDPWLSTGAPWSSPDKERIPNDYAGYIAGAYKADGIVFACTLARQLVFSEATFGWRLTENGRPGDIYSADGLDVLDRGFPGGRGELLSRMEGEAGFAGNFYSTLADDAGNFGHAATGPSRRVVRMRPDWTTIVIGSRSGDPHALDSKVVGYLYEPVGSGYGDAETVVLMPDEVCHYAPIPDPEARFRGMSWLTPVLREVEADRAATKHKLKFFENGASLQTVARFDKDISPENFSAFVKKFKAHHTGADNAYKTLFLGGGADVTVVGADLKQIDFRSTQGAGETRIAAAARVHPVIVGLSEGMQGSSLNAGNYGAAKRNFVDGTVRPLWRMAAHALQNLVTPPDAGATLWYDDRDIAFLRDDRRDVAEIQSKQSATIRNLVDAGYTAKSVVAAVQAEDWRLLAHSGLFSVQLQKPGSTSNPTDPDGGGTA
jgi:hypothetical protein